MSGVVLRCPHCGTTRAAPGECDACHEAPVRYYCTNHNPGRWVDSRSCAACGATFGDPPRPPAPSGAAPPRARPPAGPARPPTDVPSRTRTPKPSPPPAMRRDRAGVPPPAPGGWPPRIDVESWDHTERAPPIEIELAPVGRALGGCLVRMVMLAVFALVLIFLGLFLLGGSLLGVFRLY